MSDRTKKYSQSTKKTRDKSSTKTKNVKIEEPPISRFKASPNRAQMRINDQMHHGMSDKSIQRLNSLGKVIEEVKKSKEKLLEGYTYKKDAPITASGQLRVFMKPSENSQATIEKENY